MSENLVCKILFSYYFALHFNKVPSCLTKFVGWFSLNSHGYRHIEWNFYNLVIFLKGPKLSNTESHHYITLGLKIYEQSFPPLILRLDWRTLLNISDKLSNKVILTWNFILLFISSSQWFKLRFKCIKGKIIYGIKNEFSQR